jgi:triacylglycerol lipase
MKAHFDPHSLSGSFTPCAGLSLGEAASLAYEGQEVISGTIGDWGFADTSTIFNKGDTQGFIALNEDLLILSFRGTANFRDWLYNLDVLPKEEAMGKVHGGFVDALNQVWDTEVKPVLREDAPGRRVWYTGHSLGAALATLAAARTRVQHPDVSINGIVTFGQPRLASRQFEEEFDKVFDGLFHRYVNNVDIVPRVPPGYRHVGELIHFDRDGNIIQPDIKGFEAFGGSDIAYDDMSEVEFGDLQAALDRVPVLNCR